ncbi:MAG: hypothetical protein HKM07_02590 [Chlamydiae bacterium]|nr:hypothetical protein [Chlamydiota bacterium]
MASVAKVYELSTVSSKGALPEAAPKINDSPLIDRMQPLSIPNSSKWTIAITLFTSIGGAVFVHLKKPFQEKSAPIAIAIGALGAFLAVSKLVSSVISAANTRFTKVNGDINAANNRIEKLNQLASELISLKTLLNLPLDTVAPEKLEEVVGTWLQNSQRLVRLVQVLSDSALDRKIGSIADMMDRSVNLNALLPVLTTLYKLVGMEAQAQAADGEFKELAARLTKLNTDFEAARGDLEKARVEIEGLKRTVGEVRVLLEIGDEASIQDAITGIKGKLQDALAKQEASQQLLRLVAGKLSIEEEPSEANLGPAIDKLAEDIQAEKRAAGEAKTAAADTLKEIARALDLAEDSEIGAVQGEIAKLMNGKDSAEIVGQIAAKIKPAERTAESIIAKLDELTAKVETAERATAEANAAKEKFEPIVDALAKLLNKDHDQIVGEVTALKEKAEAPPAS